MVVTCRDTSSTKTGFSGALNVSRLLSVDGCRVDGEGEVRGLTGRRLVNITHQLTTRHREPKPQPTPRRPAVNTSTLTDQVDIDDKRGDARCRTSSALVAADMSGGAISNNESAVGQLLQNIDESRRKKRPSTHMEVKRIFKQMPISKPFDGRRRVAHDHSAWKPQFATFHKARLTGRRRKHRTH